MSALKCGSTNGRSKWEDPSPGRARKGFRANDYLGLVLSPDALASEWVKSEVGAA